MLARVPATWLPGLRQLLESRGGVAKWWHRVQSTMEEELGDLWGEVEGVEGAIQARADAVVQAELDAWNALDAEERRRKPRVGAAVRRRERLREAEGGEGGVAVHLAVRHNQLRA